MNKKDLHFIGILKGISQYEVLGDTTALVLELNGKYYISFCRGMYDFQDNLIKRVCGCYHNNYDHTYLGEEIIVE